MNPVRVCPRCGDPLPGLAPCPRDGGRPVLVSPQDLALVGTTLEGRFRVERVLGAGGMGTVFLARQASMDRDVVVKVLRADRAGHQRNVDRFRREARVLGRLRDPHAVTPLDFGVTPDRRLYLAMELLHGRPLDEVLRTEGALSPERAVSIAQQVLGALGEAHRAGILHRDLKPGNLFLVDRDGARDFVKVLDFGLAKIQDEGTLGTTDAICGTPDYMSPEQARGLKIGPRSDFYALGLVLFEMLTGQVPFPARTPLHAAQLRVENRAPTLEEACPLTPFPPALSAAVARLLERDPNLRPANAREAKTLLAAALGKPTTPGRPQRTSGSRRLAARHAPADAPAVPEASGPRATPPLTTPPRARRIPSLPAWQVVAALLVGLGVGMVAILLARG